MDFTEKAFKILSQDLDNFIYEVEMLLKKLRNEKVQNNRLAAVEEKIDKIKVYKQNSNVFK